MTDIYGEVEKWKQDYLYILQSSITVPTGDLMDGLEVKLYGGNTHRLRVQALLEEARIINPSLPTFERLARSNVHVDKYGFRHTHDTEGLLLHYICSQLQQHYHTHTSQYHIHLQHWRHTLQRGKSKLLDAKDVKQLCRRGIPAQYRADVWRHLVYHHVRDVMEEKGSHYFINLCNTAHESEFAGRYRKQISLDLLRTMPSNVRFNHIRSEGTRQLQTVLLAFCHHNTTVGYCQGMNFIAGMSLLFLGPEDAFWTLVAMTEKYFSPSYFDQYLTGAQADQEVLKEMVQDKLPTLAAHLRSVDIDLSTITLNWFLAVFFDAVPFETLVRIWDIFLLEGPKVLFRLAIAMLHINLEGILEKKDTISIMRHLKSCARITYDVEGLIRVAFEDLKPFPRRRDINSRQVFYANSLKEHIDKKLACRQTFEDQDQVLRDLDVSGSPVFECAVSTEGEVWVCYGSQNSAQVCVVNVGERLLYSTPIQLDTRIMCVTGLGDRILLIGTLAKRLYAYNLKTKEELWCLHVHDTILSMSCFEDSGDDNKLFASLADGTIAVIENITFIEPVESPYYIPIGRSPVTYLTVIQSRLWCACGNEVHIMHANTLDMIDRFTVSSSPFDTILSLTYQQGYGVWLSVRGSSILELWDPKQLTCKMLYDVKENRHPLFHKEDESTLNPHRITCLLPYDTSLWIGTGDGTVIVCDINAMFTDTSSSATESITPSPYSTPSTRGVIDARSFQTKVQQLYDEMTEIKDMNVQGRKSTEKRKSGNKDEAEKVIEKKTTRRKKREQINGDMLVNGDSLNIDKKSNRRSSVEKENGIEISSVTDENDNNKLLSRKKSSRTSKRLLKREDNHVVDDEPIRFTKMNGEVPGKNKPVDETIEKKKPKAEQHHKNGDSAFSIVDFTGITNIEQDETTTNGRRRDRHRRKSGDKPKPSTTDNVLPHTYGKYERSVLSQMLMKAHQQKCNGTSSEELPVNDAVESGNSLLPITETHNEAPSGIPAMLELDEKSLNNHGIALTPDIREYDATGIEVSNLMSTLSPISESRESLSSPAGSERTPSPVQGRTDDAARLSIPDININRLSPSSARSSSPSVSVSSQPEGVYSFELSLQVKMKIADRPLKSFVTTRLGEEPVIISFAGHHGDDEAVLQWKREKNEKIWTNAPILEVCPETQYPMHPQYMRHISAVRSHSADDLLEESADPDSYVVVKLQKSASCDD